MSLDNKDLASGILFIAIGLFFGLKAWFGLSMGGALNMGPGYFPLLLGVLLCCLGAVIALASLAGAERLQGRVKWRGVALVIGAILFFALTVRGLGMAPALLGCALLAAMAPDGVSLRSAAGLALLLTGFCLAVFIYGLGLPYPVIGPWLRG